MFPKLSLTMNPPTLALGTHKVPQDSLFLLEVLIDKVVFTQAPCFSDKDFRTCVTVECPSVAALEICDDEPSIPHTSGPFTTIFNSGKSCLFSMKEADIAQARNKFPIKVNVFKTLPCGCIPTKIPMGHATIDLTKEFIETVNKYEKDPSNMSYQALKDKFLLVSPEGPTGEIMMYFRISCFGNTLITKFQGVSCKPSLGSGKAETTIDRSCNPERAYQTPDNPCVCGASHGHGRKFSGRSDSAGRRHAPGCPKADDLYNKMPCAEEDDDPCYCCGATPSQKDPMTCRNTDQYCLHIPKDCCPPGNKVVFQMPSELCNSEGPHHKRMHFNFNSDGVGDMSRDEPDNLMPTTNDNYPGVVYDLGKQVIKLRVGKVVEMPGRTSKLEYQFITPVISHEREVPVTDTRTAQCSAPPCQPCCRCKLPSLPLCQDLPEHQKSRNTTSPETILHNLEDQDHLEKDVPCHHENKNFIKEYLFDSYQFPTLQNAKITEPSGKYSASWSNNLWNSKSDSFGSSSGILSKSNSLDTIVDVNHKPLIGAKAAVYQVGVCSSEEKSCHQHSCTQATTSINKCMQVPCTDLFRHQHSTNSAFLTSTTTISESTAIQDETERYTELYFFGRNNKKYFKNFNEIDIRNDEEKDSSDNLSLNDYIHGRFEKNKYGSHSSGVQASPKRVEKGFSAQKKRPNKTKLTQKYSDKYCLDLLKKKLPCCYEKGCPHNYKLIKQKASMKQSECCKEKICMEASKDKNQQSPCKQKICLNVASPKLNKNSSKSSQASETATQTIVHAAASIDQKKKSDHRQTTDQNHKPVKSNLVNTIQKEIFQVTPVEIQVLDDSGLVATVSHIRIGPSEVCPVHGCDPCEGTVCIQASKEPPKTPVKVSTVNNPRRGVFEIVIRKMTGAPLATNELMLEWTPPPRPQTYCGIPCLPQCMPKCNSVCRPRACVLRTNPRKSCPTPRYKRVCPTLNFTSPCYKTCTLSKVLCKNSPCLRRCRVRRQRRRHRMWIKPHRPRISPCLNRSWACPVIRCRSVPGPCHLCGKPTPCPSRPCCSISHCPPARACSITYMVPSNKTA